MQNDDAEHITKKYLIIKYKQMNNAMRNKPIPTHTHIHEQNRKYAYIFFTMRLEYNEQNLYSLLLLLKKQRNK